MTLELGLMRTCLLQRFSALLIDFNASAKTFMRTILNVFKRFDLKHLILNKLKLLNYKLPH